MGEIRFFMEESAVAVDPTPSIREAAQKMHHHSIPRRNRIVGMLSIKGFANFYNFKFCQGKNQEDQIGHYMGRNLKRFLNQPPYIKPHGS